jgi:hypothetical protein
MKFNDAVYGSTEITEPVVLELMASPTMERLKGVDQTGHGKPYFGDSHYNRYQHSVGVLLLLKKYNAPLEEQIAGLLHDVSHSAFSHSIDYVFDEGSEAQHSYQDDILNDFVKNSDIPRILNRHGIDVNYILDDDNFPLKEKKLPDLCADRIDYSLKSALAYHERDIASIQKMLSNLTVKDSQWVFRDMESARSYAEIFKKLNSVYYASFLSAVMFRTTGDSIKYALEKGYITKDDLYTTDEIVINKMFSKRSDPKMTVLLDRMDNKIKAVNDPENYESKVVCKSRAVDPLFLDSNRLTRLSSVDNNWAKVVEEELKPKTYYIRFVEK